MEVTRETCADFAVSSEREWLVTNGTGSYAAGTVADAPTRCYHGLLVAALAPPLGRTVLCSKFDVRLTYAGRTFDLTTTRWQDGTLAPAGYVNIERCRLDGTTPVWTFSCADAVVERRIWMDRGRDATYVRYSLIAANGPAQFEGQLFAVDRDHHATMHAFDVAGVTAIDANSARIALGDGTPWFAHVENASLTAGGEWYYGVSLARETERGLPDRDDIYRALDVRTTLSAGTAVTLLMTTQVGATLDAAVSHSSSRAHDSHVLECWRARSTPAQFAAAPVWLPQLVLAADQFIVDRATSADPAGKTVIAGYPWFGDWGRDTMIALPGLTLVTGRPQIARSILRTFAHYVDAGMLPNRFPDCGSAPEYNTVDATLWYVVALDAYVRATDDRTTLRDLFSGLTSIVDWHVRGTRYGIGVDPADGLLRSGQPGVALTWMDARVGDRAVTPRTGKAVEINALWYNALRMIAAFARLIGADAGAYDAHAERVRASYGRFWNPQRAYLYDVIDGPLGADAAIRPNAVIALSLPHALLDAAIERTVMTRAAAELLTPYGLRSLSPEEPGYVSTYGGDPSRRDASYHCGTVWPWLAGPFAAAHRRVFNDRAAIARLLEPIAALIRANALGTLAEIADGAAPFHPRGCFAQAWSVAAILGIVAAQDEPTRSLPDLHEH